ncbi:hypothetical protein DESAMIL20_228 [Desulfurella amilsii]|uniref:DUF1015 domain-containing protein n=1 Tax=Desulfurella amilsii TaxID=1562698 RepID=A0A1X4Y025_9BACT|nr:DUF1015 domain-containing protein [Desulfurella amilsii]OSS43120.1 hypothetical protein DESAMIL20_228 [Desulfurella amilsii]
MPIVEPFKGIFFKEKKIDTYVCPPYDVIDSDYKNQLLSKDEFNIVRIVLPEGENDQKYKNAKNILKAWILQKKLIFDEDCSFYAYSCKYSIDGVEKTLFGFLGALKLEELGGSIKPHEKTLKGPKIDRFKLITSTNAMFCPIMMIYDNVQLSDFIKKCNKEDLFEVNFENKLHKVYKINDASAINHIKQKIKNQTLVIADGHHRYETCLSIKEHYKQIGQETPGSDYALVFFVDKNDELSLMPIHRLIKKINIDKLKQKLYNFFEIGDVFNYDIVMYDGEFTYLKYMKKITDGLIERLDVKIFEDVVFKGMLNLSDADIASNEISGYAHSKEEVVKSVDRKEAAAGFLLKPITYDTLFEITSHNLTFPQKSTYFYPKIPSGLVGYHFSSIEGCKNV